ncbi:MAG: hypothetical protein SGJ21_06490 [Alphaproteobacteria bacterium]|nr:hypothetical protein [Alphaproteobacteria bacterium]
MLKRLLVLATLVGSVAQAHAQSHDIPRTTDGRPDFHGVWESRWRTPLERLDEADGPIVHAEQVRGLIAALDKRAAALTGLHPDEDFDWGTLMPAAGGGFRTSLIVEPADGKLPLTPEARDWAKTIKDVRDRAEDPEARNLWERCIRGPGNTPLSISPGNMNRLIVQTDDHVVINTEDMAEARIIAFVARNRPAALVSTMGESTGHWEGDVLVIETRLLRPDPASPPGTEGQAIRKLTESLRFSEPNELSYEYTLEDSGMFIAPMRVAFTLVRTKARMFEASCHEGNYSLANILSGARVVETRAMKAKP